MSTLNEIVVDRFARYYLATGGWGPLAPVLTHGRLKDRDVDGCANMAAIEGDHTAESLCLELDAMTRAQRALVAVKAEKAAADLLMAPDAGGPPHEKPVRPRPLI